MNGRDNPNPNTKKQQAKPQNIPLHEALHPFKNKKLMMGTRGYRFYVGTYIKTIIEYHILEEVKIHNEDNTISVPWLLVDHQTTNLWCRSQPQIMVYRKVVLN